MCPSLMVTLSSLAARAAVGTLSAYAATKGAIYTPVKHFASVRGAHGGRVERSRIRGRADQYVELCLHRGGWITGDAIQVDGGSKLSLRRCAGMSPRINGKRDLNHGNEPT
jgi:hypothetical protein